MKGFKGKYLGKKIFMIVIFLLTTLCSMFIVDDIQNISTRYNKTTSKNDVVLQSFNDVNVEEEIGKLTKCKPLGFTHNKNAEGTIGIDETYSFSVKFINSDYYEYNKVKVSEGREIQNYRPQKGQDIEVLCYSENLNLNIGEKQTIIFAEYSDNTVNGKPVEISRITFDVTIVGILDREFVKGEFKSNLLLIPEIIDIVDYGKYVAVGEFYTLFYDSQVNLTEAREEFREIGYLLNDYNEYKNTRRTTYNGYAIMIFIAIGAFVVLYNYYNSKIIWNNFFEEKNGNVVPSKNVIITTLVIDLFAILFTIFVPRMFLFFSRLNAYLYMMMTILTLIIGYITMAMRVWKYKGAVDTNTLDTNDPPIEKL